ncbi:MAG: carbohydrate-binding domain-containing protein [Eubacteriales bacterium]|nr:carbohydrate-binding domain-containing protein [Eubacteriales bacterium]
MKKQLSVILCVAILLLFVSAQSFSVSAETVEADLTDATSFVFSDQAIAVTEGAYAGYEVSGTALKITSAGVYVLSGSCSDGSVTVKKGTKGVTLVLAGLSLSSSNTAPICCNKSTAVTILVLGGTVNTLTDSEMNNDETYPDNGSAENAVIKGKDGSQIVLCGTGELNVVANGKNGIKGGATTEAEGEASLTIQELTLNVTVNANDGIKSDQALNILSGTITVSAVDDGIKSDLFLTIGEEGTAGPILTIVKSNEGIEGAQIHIYSGTITVHATDDGINAANSDLTDYAFDCTISGGTVWVDAQNGDGIDSNGTLTISGGVVTVFSSSRNDNSPLDSEKTLTVSGGTVLAVGSSGMAQTPNQAGQVYVTYGASGRGGMNGGQPGNPGGRPGSRPTSDTVGETGSIGSTTDAASGDADAGTTLGFPGGFPGGNPGGFPDAMENGSTLAVQTGDKIAILDASGNTLCSATALRAATYIFFSSDALTEGQTYSLTINGTSVATANASKDGASGGFPGGNPGGPIGTPSGEPTAAPTVTNQIGDNGTTNGQNGIVWTVVITAAVVAVVTGLIVLAGILIVVHAKKSV